MTKEIISKIKGERQWLYQKTKYTERVPVYDKNAAYNGPTLITSVAKDNTLSVRIISMKGALIHEWNIDWFEIWPDATHIPDNDDDRPKSQPGTHIHGVELLENGDLVFNFEHLGLVRLDVCGKVVWRLPYRTHHSIYKDEYNNLWVSGQKKHTRSLSDLPNYKPIFKEPTVLKVSEDGKILNEISILSLLKENNLQGLLFMSSKNNLNTVVSGDIFHLNDVEIFPSFKDEGVFKAGDIMVSLRNINTILIFSEKDQKIKYISIGEFVRQHDPDFIDGNTISVFDNNNIAPKNYGHQSRIVIKSFKDNQSHVYYTGSKKNRFYTEIMGKHQWLSNGNMLISESMKGRAFEIDKNGNTVWEYVNIVDKGYIGILEEAKRLPNKYSKDFFERSIQKNSQLKFKFGRK
ncbi:MAG: hypothetical protein GY931_04645 [Maribacter sp.]|nr:hypothetical protein [Candidatus Brocadiaceae bacterium]MCP4975428.1 hypothetical protein [Maribacter sp.]